MKNYKAKISILIIIKKLNNSSDLVNSVKFYKIL